MPANPVLNFPQTVTLHFKNLSTTRVSKYVYDSVLSKVTVSFQVQSDKTRQYREYTTTLNNVTQATIDAEGAGPQIATAWEGVWLLYHDDILAFVAAESVKPSSNEVFQIPEYTS
jgi:hypothetical protein